MEAGGMTDILVVVEGFAVTNLKCLRALQTDFLALVALCFPSAGLGNFLEVKCY